MLSGGTALVEKIQESNAAVNKLREFGLWGNDDLTGAARQATEDLGKRIDRAALRGIYETTNGGSWKKKNNWLPSSGNRFAFSNWHGVKTSSNGRVSELELSDNNLVGGLTNALEAMHLVWLNLSENRLSGEILSELGNLTRLQSLDLHDNELTGDIPSELGNLTRLQYLLLYDNKLTGEVPEFSESSRLFSVYLNDNNLSGNLPPGLPRSLTSLVVSDNPLLSGRLPLDPMVHTEVSNLDIKNTDICVPDTPEFQQWLMGISFFAESGMTCGEEPPPPPGQVTGVSVTPGVLQLSVLWNAVSDADGYKVQWKLEGSQEFDQEHTVPSGSTTTYTIPNLTASTPYTIIVIATKSNADDGQPSLEVPGTPHGISPPPPPPPIIPTTPPEQQPEDLGPVTGVEVTEKLRQLSVSWEEFPGASGYRVQWKSGALDFASTRQHTVPSGSTTTYAIPNLTAGTRYTIRVIAIVSNADSPPSEEVTATPREEGIPQPPLDREQRGGGGCAIGSTVPGEVSQSALFNMLVVMSALLAASRRKKRLKQGRNRGKLTGGNRQT